jgi:hypothetical protein
MKRYFSDWQAAGSLAGYTGWMEKAVAAAADRRISVAFLSETD